MNETTKLDKTKLGRTIKLRIFAFNTLENHTLLLSNYDSRILKISLCLLLFEFTKGLSNHAKS